MASRAHHSTQFLILPSKKHRDPAPILQLSAKLLRLIYRNIRHPADQVRFALCCKTIAKIAKTTKLNTFIVLSLKESVIRAYNIDDLKQELQCWKSLRKCKGCQDMLPKRRIWTTEEGVELAKLKNVDWIWAVKDWMGGGQLCPPCRISEHYDGTASGWLQCRPEGFAKVTMFHNVERKS